MTPRAGDRPDGLRDTKVFAPGKIVLTGAYAVLGGAPAIVAATRRGAYADVTRIEPRPSPEVAVALGATSAPHVDASSLFRGSRKLGLGASAAILVASLAAIEAASGADLSASRVREALFRRARDAHAAAQQGGSGVDVAASVHGGVLEYVPGLATPRALPLGTRLAVFACSASASTMELRLRVESLARSSPSRHRACIAAIEVIARDAAAAVAAGARDGFIDSIRRAARALDHLGTAANAPIVPAGFEDLEALAAAEGAAFCVSGAGGGDVAVFVGSAAPSPAFDLGARALGLVAIDVDLDEKGVRAVSLPAATAAAVEASSTS